MTILLVSIACVFGFSVWDRIPGRDDVPEHKDETKPAGQPAEMARRLTTHSAGRKPTLNCGPPKAVLGFWSARLGWPAVDVFVLVLVPVPNEGRV